MNKEKTIYQRMLEDRFYLYRPWIPICKSIEAEAVKELNLVAPVLDIGCGNGLFATYCYKERIDVGLDYDKGAVKSAEEKQVYKRVETADARKLPFKDNEFQTIISVCAIEHIPELDKVLSEARRILMPGGKFYFTVPSEMFGESLFGSKMLSFFGLKGLARRYGDKKNRKSGHFHVYSGSKWQELLKKEGFGKVIVKHIFPKEAVLLWSFFHSLPFKIVFLPFRIFRDLNIRFFDCLLRAMLSKLLTSWLKAKSYICPADGGYLLIEASKN